MSKEHFFGPSWFVSPWNFEEKTNLGKRIVVHDTTLRDGEQQAGVTFSVEQKVRIAHALDGMGVDRIEAGMVAVSEDDREAVRRIVRSDHKAEIWTIARSLATDVEQAIACGVDGVGIILLGNQQYCKIFGWTLENALGKALGAAEMARSAGLKTALLVADSPRLSRPDLETVVRTASASGCFGALALMDTFGSLSPLGTKTFINAVREMTDIPLEFHGHNDFGLAVANSLVALEAGAGTIHTSLLGLGERVGNTALEELILAAKILYGAESLVDLGHLYEAASLVKQEIGIAMAPHKPVVGDTITHIESGTVASEYARWSQMPDAPMQWLFAYLPSLVGGPAVELVLGKGSGLANIEAALMRVGAPEVPQDVKRSLLDRVKSEGTRLRRALTDEEFRIILAEQVGALTSHLRRG